MIARLSRYATARDMTIDCSKSKVMKFGSGGKRSSHKWPCGNDYLEEVPTFTYLGFTFQSTGHFTAHLKSLETKGRAAVSAVWSIGERLRPENRILRLQMFQALVAPIISYGCELFGFSQHEEIEKSKRRYLRWILGVAPWTRKYLLLEETKSTPVHISKSKLDKVRVKL